MSKEAAELIKIKALWDSMPELAPKFKVTGLAYLALLLPYRCKVVYPRGEEVKVGRASFYCLNSVLTFGKNDSSEVVEIGDFCENAGSSHIIAGGEHNNGKPINHSLAGIHDLIKDEKTYSKGKIIIGNNVTISRNVTIVSGVTIGDGVVIGAGAVVTKNIPPFSIIAGNPAKILKPRFSAEDTQYTQKIRWWDMTLASLTKHYHAIQSFQPLSTDPDYEKQIDKECYLVFSCTPNDGKPDFHFLGVEVAGKNIPHAKLPDEFKLFIKQIAAKPGEYIYLIRDIFRLSGLIS